MKLKKDTTFRILYAVFSQGMLGIMSVLTSIVLPKLMGPEQYGYFQEFTFYLMYLNMLSIGLNDGITLNYAGKGRDEIPICEFRSAIAIHSVYTVILTIIVVAASIIALDTPKTFIFIMIGLNIVPTVLFCVFCGIFLAENNSYIYNTLNMVQRALFCVMIIALIVLHKSMYYEIILANTVANWIIFIVSAIKSKDYIIGERSSLKKGFVEYKKLIASGIMIALSVSFMGLVPTFGRVVIEYNDTIYNYGVYSFYIGLLSIVLTFANAIGIVAFPMLRNTSEKRLVNSYNVLEKMYRMLGGAMFFIYPVLVYLIGRYMIKYESGIVYFAFLFALCYPLGKIQMIIVPYYKNYRLEKKLFIINTICIAITICADYAAFLIFKQPLAVAVSTLFCCLLYYTFLVFGVPSILKTYNFSIILDWITPIAFTIIAINSTGVKFAGIYFLYYIIALAIVYVDGRNGKLLRR